MIAALIAVVGILGILVVTFLSREIIQDLQAQNRELLTLLEARAAPAEHAAYLTPFPEPDDTQYLVDDSGLFSYPVPD